MIKNITYLLTCNICKEEYVGETGRLKRNRCWEHYKSLRDSNNKTAMGNHYLKAHPDIVDIPLEPFKFDLIDKCKDFVDRQIKQSQLIKHRSPRINTQLSDEVDAWIKHTWTLM